MNSNLIVRLLRLSIAFIIIGSLFKLMHWPFASMLTTIGLGSIVLLYPIRFYLKKEKQLIDYVKLVFLVFFPINVYLKLFHLPTIILLPIITFSSFVLWISLELYYRYLGKPELKYDNSKVYPFGILSIIILFLFMGFYYKMMNFPFTIPMLLFGFAFITVYFLIKSFKNKK